MLFVSKSSSWYFVPICFMTIELLSIFSRTEWQSISLCFVLSWNTRLVAMWIVVLLSQNISVILRDLKFNSSNMLCIHDISLLVLVIDLNSAYSEDRKPFFVSSISMRLILSQWKLQNLWLIFLWPDMMPNLNYKNLGFVVYFVEDRTNAILDIL